jgi:phosphoadenosine phosphosulfate reductase
MTSTRIDLRAVAAAAAQRFADGPAADVIAWAASTFPGRLAVAASMQDGVLPHLASRFAPDADVLFLDTGYHFAQTLQTRVEVAQRYRLRVLDVRPVQTVAEQDAQYGPQLHDRDPNLCCALRKTAPLDDALGSYEAWINGLRHVDAPTRAHTPVVDYDEKRDMVKISPLAAWSDEDIENYIFAHEVIVNPLLRQGYPSIGCAPCTRAVAPGADPRSGRWAGFDKTECGIHL